MEIKVRRVDFSPDEWIAGTVTLTNAERGLYITACALIYSHGGPISRDHLRSSCADHGNAFNRQLDHLLSLGKLIENAGEIDQKRCGIELENARKRVGNARENGAKGGRPNGLKNPEGGVRSKANHQPSLDKTISSPQEAAFVLSSAGVARAPATLTGGAHPLPANGTADPPKPEPLTPEQQKMYDEMIAKREHLA